MATAAACTNCGGGPVARFCAECGQKRITPHDFTARAFFHETLSEFISVDGRFWRTLWTLIRHPGLLARDYFDGRGARYMRPLNLFLLLNLTFFIIQPHTGLLQWHLAGYLGLGDRAWEQVNEKRLARAAEAEQLLEERGGKARPLHVESMEAFTSEFESTIQNLKKSMLLVAIPLFSAAVAFSYAFRQHRMAEHLVFSTHFYAFNVFTLTVLIPVAFAMLTAVLRLVHAPVSVFRAISGELALTTALFLMLGSYLFVALRRMYADSRLTAAVRATALFAFYQFLVIVFAVRMFQVTLWAM